MRRTSVFGTACLAFVLLLASCSSDGAASATGPDGRVSAPDYDAAGPAVVAVVPTAVTDGARGRRRQDHGR